MDAALLDHFGRCSGERRYRASRVSIGINLPVYPELVPVPGYPVYYAPQVNSNYFFYDGMYWVYQGDNWYASSWYNGPWGLVGPEVVPLFVLRVPVRYYRQPPAYFRGWQSDAPPRWGEHWGNGWEQRRSGWDRWKRSSAPTRAPLPVYQRQYSGDRYPRVEQQHTLRSQSYRYQPRDAIVRQHYQEQAVPRAPAPSQRGQRGAPQERSPRQQDPQRSNPPPPLQQGGPAVPRSQPPRPQRAAPAPAAPPQVAPPAPTAQPPEQRGKAEQRGGKREQRGEPLAPPQRSAQPKVAPSPQVAPPAPAAQQPAQRPKPEPAPAAKQAEPRPPVAAPKPPPPQPQPAPKAEPRGQEPKPAAGKPNDKKKDSDEQKREEENRKQKG